jgi:hypothetical protein
MHRRCGWVNDSATAPDPGIYWTTFFFVGRGIKRQFAVRLDRGLVQQVEPAEQVDFAPVLPQDKKLDFASWYSSLGKGVAIVSSQSWRKRRTFPSFTRLRRAADRSFVYLGKEFSAQIAQLRRLSRTEIVELIFNSLVVAIVGRVPLIGTAMGLMDDAQSAARLGIAGGMAAWGTSAEDIEVSAKLIAREVGEFLLGKGVEVVGKGAGAARGVIGKRGKAKRPRGIIQEAETPADVPPPPRGIKGESKQKLLDSKGISNPETIDKAVSAQGRAVTRPESGRPAASERGARPAPVEEIPGKQKKRGKQVEREAIEEDVAYWKGRETATSFARHGQTFDSLVKTLKNKAAKLKKSGQQTLLPEVNEDILRMPVDEFIRRTERLKRLRSELEAAGIDLSDFLEGRLKAGSREVGSRVPDIVEFLLDRGEIHITDITIDINPVHTFKTAFYEEVMKAIVGPKGPRVLGLDIDPSRKPIPRVEVPEE